MGARGIRLGKTRIAEIIWYVTDAGGSYAFVKAQRYQSSSPTTAPGTLLAQERFVHRSSETRARLRQIGFVRDELVRLSGIDVASDVWSRIERVCRYIATRSKREGYETMEPLDREFGAELVPLVADTPAARARAKLAWPYWICAEKSWCTERSRAVASQLEDDYQRELARVAQAREAGVWSGLPTAGMAAARMWKRFDELEATEAYMDLVAQDVIDRAVHVKTRDDDLVHLVRTQADERMSADADAIGRAWDEVDEREILLPRHGDGRGKERAARARALLERKRSTPPPPQTDEERIEACDRLLVKLGRPDLTGPAKDDDAETALEATA